MDEKKKSEVAVREKLEAMRDKIVLKVGEKRLKAIVNIFSALILVLVGSFIISLFLRVNAIDVSGDVTMFNEGDVIKAARLSEGDLLYGRSCGNIERTIKKNMPLAKNVNVKKTISGKVSINISFEKVDFYCKIGERYYALNEDLRVMDHDESRSKYSAFGAVFVRLPEVREPILGEKLVFYDTVEETDTEGETLYEVKKDSFYEFTVDFLKVFKNSGYLTESQAVDLREKFDIELVYADKFLVKFGDARNLNEKFRLLFEILSEGSINYASKGVIDLSDPSRAFARADESLDFTQYID